jgi:hypothetical protein
MSARHALLLSGGYARAFLGAAFSEGLIQDLDDSPPDTNIARYRAHPYRRRVLEASLLFDTVVLIDPHTPVFCDYSALHQTGMVEVLTISDTPELIGAKKANAPTDAGWWDAGYYEYAMFLKPFVLDAVLAHQPSIREYISADDRRSLKTQGLTEYALYSLIYDANFIKDPNLTVEARHVLDQCTPLHKFGLEFTAVNGKPSRISVGYLLASELVLAVGELMFLLEATVQRDGMLMQSKFDMSTLELDRGGWRTDNVKQLHHSYQILRVSLDRNRSVSP